MRVPRLYADAHNHRGSLALLSTCRQLRHETSSTFHIMAVFKVSTFVLKQLSGSYLIHNSERWNSIQSIQMRGYEVERWCNFADIYHYETPRNLGRKGMYVGFLPSLKNVLVVYHVDDADDCWGYSYRAIADILKLNFGKSNLCVRIQADS